MESEPMPGDAEAAGAVAGMIETNGLPHGDTPRRRWSAFVGTTWGDFGFTCGPVEYEEIRLPAIDGRPAFSVLRSPQTGIVASGFVTEIRYHDTEANAIVATIEKLLSRREILTTQVESLRDRLRDLINADAADAIEVIK
jgi:hypothetical protein